MIYLDNAATTGHKPIAVRKAVAEALEKYSANPGRSGHAAAQRTGEFVYKTREKVAMLFGANPENIVFTQNCTQAANFVIKGVLEEGDHAIISSMEHNAIARPVHTLKAKGIIDYDIAQVIIGDGDSTARSFERLLRPETKLIICTHISNVTGEILPIEKIASICKQHNILFAVDAAQSAGIIPINMEEMGIDFLFVAPHKGLYAPMGTGILIARKPIKNTIIEGGTGSFSNLLLQPDDMPERFESGTLNLPGIAGVSAGIDFIQKNGINRIFEYEKKLTKMLVESLKNISGVALYSDAGNAPVVSFNMKGLPSMETAEKLAQKGIAIRAGLHCAPLAHLTIGTAESGTVRVCPSIFNRESEIFMLIRAIKEINLGKNLAKNY